MARHSLGSISPQRSTAAAISSTVAAIQPVLPVDHDLGHRAARRRDHGHAAGHGLDHHQPERLVPGERVDQGVRTVQQAHALVQVDLADVRDAAAEAAAPPPPRSSAARRRPRSLPASSSGMPAARATSIAVTGPLSADMRPEPEEVLAAAAGAARVVVERDRVGNRRRPGQIGAPSRGGSRSATRARRRA